MMTMAAPSTRKAAKKAVSSPARSNGTAVAAGAPAEAPRKKAVTAKAARPTTPRAKRGSPVEAEPVSVAAEHKPKRVKKEKVVRDSFTMPKPDYEKLGELKAKCLSAGVAVKKSELLRAGLLLLEAAPLAQLLEAIAAVETVKTGRPAKPSHQNAAH
jgi:hypothetical protein